jgi:hypothetical protein
MHMNSHASQSTPESPEAAAHASEGSTRCDCCKSCGAILELDGCGHRFHPRCIYSYPVTQCELCSVPVSAVKIFRAFQNAPNSMARKGKWSADEHKYANMMMKQFQMGALPLVDGLHLRGFIANLLQCDPLRVTKKYSGHAIGKQNFYYQRHKSYCYNLHTKMQKRISSLRNHFYWHIQYRCKFGYAMNIQELKTAEADYWIREFLKFANKMGQRVELAAAPIAVESPVPSPVPSPAKAEQPPKAEEPAGIVKTEETVSTRPALSLPVQSPASSPVAPSSPVVTVSLAVDTQDEPSFPSSSSSSSLKQDAANGAVSPLSFDEWREQEAPSFVDMLDKTLLADFAKQGSQFSATLSDILNAQPLKAGGLAAPLSLSQSQSFSQSLSQSGSSTRCSLRDWLIEEDGHWNESMAGTSWSFSLPLSDCA